VPAWLNEANLGQVERWVAGLGHRSAYVVISRNMDFYAEYFGPPRGFKQLERTIPTAPGWSVVYSNADVTIYRLDLG